jgi:hypothetical protein
MTLLADRFPAAMDSLIALFGRDFIAERAHRLEEIFAVTEQAWERNVSRLQGVPVRYLLIAEAAPWTDAGKMPSYFYETLGGTWVGRVLQAFDILEREDALAKLAQCGFLLVDTLPFALPYRGKRERPRYLQLLEESRDYFLGKLCDERLRWSDDLRVALAFKVNGLKTIEAYSHGIELPSGQLVALSEQQISADRSGFTSPTMLRERFGIA